jgi:N-acetylneuraminic acid mutarotase
MTKSKLLTAFLIFTSILIAFSCPGITQNALAQPQNPPTLSSMGENLPPEPLPEVQALPGNTGPATDDYIPDGNLPAQAQPSSVPYQNFGIDSDSWIGSIPHGLQADSPQSGRGIQSTVLWDNGPLVTHPGGGYNGYDASRLQDSLSMNTYGFGNQVSAGNHTADDFEVTFAGGWQIENITFFTYQTGTYAEPPVSTITGVYLQIWDGPPDNAGSSVIFGDLVTNRILETYWTGIYRDIESSPLNATRPIMTAVASVNTLLPQGTYWLDWMIDGSSASGPWAPPITILGQTTTGNALQYTTASGAWAPANDSGSATQQGMPFVIEGTLGDWLWDQPLSATQVAAYVDQEFPDVPTASSYLADDFVVDGTWKIDRIFAPGDGWNGFSSLLNATALTWAIYSDAGGVPAGDPSGAGSTPVWSTSLPPTSPYVTLSVGYSGYLSNTLLQLPTPVKLTAGHYWLLFYPTLEFTSYGQFGLQPADTNNGEIVKFVNPGNYFGYGTEWQDWTVLGVTSHDFAFSLGGTAGFSWKSISPINSIGRSRPAAAAVNGKIYLFGGETSSGRADTVERYDPSANTWTTLAGVMPDPASNICAAVIGTDIYIPGGYDASFTYLDTLRVYHTTTNSWSVIATDPLPVGLLGMGCATLNNKLYVVGGVAAGSTPQASAYVYEPSAPAGSRWTTLASKNTADAYFGAVTINGKIFTLSGYYCPNCVEAYDPGANEWHVVTDLTSARGGAGVYAIGTNLYACGGGWYSYLDTCESYDTTQGYSGTWEAHPSILIEGRRTFGYASIGPVMYAIAGYRSAFLQTAERWSFEAYLPITIK